MTRSARRAGVLLAVLLLVVPAGAVLAQPPDHARVGAEVYEKLAQQNRVRVMIMLSAPDVAPPGDRDRLMRGVARAQNAVLNALSQEHFAVARQFQAIPALAAEIDARGLQQLLSLPGVLRIDEDAGGQAQLGQAVPLTNTDDVQSLGFTGEGITVAVLDSGIDTDHTDLGDDLVAEACFCSGIGKGGACCPGGTTTWFGAGAAEDDFGHGSNVAGIISSAGVVSAIGTAPDAGIVAIKVLDDDGVFCCNSDVVAGLDWIIANRPDVDIVNMSLGTFALYTGECDTQNPVPSSIQAYATAIDTLRGLGVLVFVSSGNDASGTMMSAPACVANSVSVGAVFDANLGSVGIFSCTDTTTAADQVTCFSNSNSTTDLFAPGAAISSDYLSNGTATFYGTSQAAPHAAGCAADILEAGPTLTPSQIEAALKVSGVTVTDAKNGLMFPRVDCLAAIDELGLPEPGLKVQLISGIALLLGIGRRRARS